MTLDNIIVRPQRKYLEKYSVKDVWKKLTRTDSKEIGEKLANLPSQLCDTEEEAKRFDCMILRAQLCVLQVLAVDGKLKAVIQKIMSELELQNNIPVICAQMPLIQSVASEEWWESVTVGMLEHVRKQLRMLIKLIEKTKRNIVYTDFEDELGEGTVIDLPITASGMDYERFKLKTRGEFLRQYSNNLAFIKLRKNIPITAMDLAELERILLEQASGNVALVAKARDEANGLGLFIRSLLGLEREAANEAMNKFLNDANATAQQMAFVRLIVDQLTQDGAMNDARLYESPFTDIAATGPNNVFATAQVTELFTVMAEIRQRAVA